MTHPVKMATCCYCASTVALTLGKGRHELSCANCGAPLRTLKRLTKPATTSAAPKRPKRVTRPAHRPKRASPRKRKPRKKTDRIGWIKEWAEEAFDLVEDLFD